MLFVSEAARTAIPDASGVAVTQLLCTGIIGHFLSAFRYGVTAFLLAFPQETGEADRYFPRTRSLASQSGIWKIFPRRSRKGVLAW